MRVQLYKRKEGAWKYAKILRAAYPSISFYPVVFDFHHWAVQAKLPDGSTYLVGLRKDWEAHKYWRNKSREKP